MVKVCIHPSLTRFTDNKNELNLTADKAKDFLPELCHLFPQLSKNIFEPSGELTPFINVYLNGKNLKTIPAETPLRQEDEMNVVTALVGG